MDTYKPPPDAASVFARYKELHDGERDLKPAMLELADRELKAGASVGQLAKHTGLLPEVFRRRARALGVERKRAPTVGRLSETPGVTHPIGSPEWVTGKSTPTPPAPEET